MGVDALHRENKAEQLAIIEGMSIEEMAENALYDGIAYGICMNHDCDYTTNVEPDSCSGWCENCGTNTVCSIVELALF